MERLKKKKGSYSQQMRTLARQLVKAGCARGKVGRLIRDTASVFGLQIKCEMSRRTVNRAVLEGWIASRMQLGYEMKRTGCAQDSTGHRHRNIEAHHIAYRAPDYSLPGAPLAQQPSIRLVSVNPTVDHSSAVSKEGWTNDLATIMSMYSTCPLSKRTSLALTIRELAQKLRGGNTDH
ncbi:hypothetical protein F5878DRAFT_550185, partial [Lentinula raphanica]